FGELLSLIERDKRGPENAIPLQYSDPEGEGFSIPANVYVLGLMNTADRSLALVDYALRRRFAFGTLNPLLDTDAFQLFLESKGADSGFVNQLVTRVSGLNKTISDARDLGRGFEIGHSFFCPPDGVVPDAAWFNSVVNFEISQLLDEYWFNDPYKVRASLRELRM